MQAQNNGNGPLVYDHASAQQRIYLFGRTLGKLIGRGGQAARARYLESWSSLTTASHRTEASTDPTGAPVTGANSSIDGAIEIQTGDLDTERQVAAFLSLSMGSLTCYAQDAR